MAGRSSQYKVFRGLLQITLLASRQERKLESWTHTGTVHSWVVVGFFWVIFVLFCFFGLGGGWVGWCGLHVANQLPNLEQNTGFFTFRSLHDSQPPPPSNVSADVQLWSRSAVPRATSVPKQQWGFTPSGTCIQPCYSACPPGTARCSVNLLP